MPMPMAVQTQMQTQMQMQMQIQAMPLPMPVLLQLLTADADADADAPATPPGTKRQVDDGSNSMSRQPRNRRSASAARRPAATTSRNEGEDGETQTDGQTDDAGEGVASRVLKDVVEATADKGSSRS
jgi:hypothetical protein